MRNASWIVVVLSLTSAPLMAEDRTIEPGLYEVTTKSSMGAAQTARVCLTAKDIVNGLNPVTDQNCKRVRSIVAGGKLDFATTCPDMSMTMTGSYTPTSYVIDGKITIKGDDPMTMESHIAAKRVAETCKAS